LGAGKHATGELLFDWKAPAKPAGTVGVNLGAAGVTFDPDGMAQVGVAAGSTVAASEKAEAKGLKAGAWNRVVLTFDGKKATATVNGVAAGTAEVKAAAPALPVVFHPTDGLEIRNVYLRELPAKT
jgi:hypothetical protein